MNLTAIGNRRLAGARKTVACSNPAHGNVPQGQDHWPTGHDSARHGPWPLGETGKRSRLKIDRLWLAGSTPAGATILSTLALFGLSP